MKQRRFKRLMSMVLTFALVCGMIGVGGVDSFNREISREPDWNKAEILKLVEEGALTLFDENGEELGIVFKDESGQQLFLSYDDFSIISTSATLCFVFSCPVPPTWKRRPERDFQATCVLARQEYWGCDTGHHTLTFVGSPIGHNFPANTWTVTRPATCTVAGTRSRICSRNGCDVAAEHAMIPWLGHSWSAWQYINSTSCQQRRTCGRSGCTIPPETRIEHDSNFTGSNRVCSRVIACGEVRGSTSGLRYMYRTTNAPTVRKVSSGFGNRTVNGTVEHHDGIDITHTSGGPATHGVPIYSVSSGKVLEAREISGFGHVVIVSTQINSINHTIVYSHLVANSYGVSLNQNITTTQRIGNTGNTGRVFPAPTTSNPHNGTHLHFELRRNGTNATNGTPRDPRDYYPTGVFS